MKSKIAMKHYPDHEAVEVTVEESPKTVTELLDEICADFCENYCKYPGICLAERKDPDEADELCYQRYCGDCPLNKV
jgi:hypothetical protein